MASSRRMDGALLLKWRGVAARDRRLGLQHLPLTDLPPESPHSSPRGRGEGRERAPRPGDGDGGKEVDEEEGDSDA